MMKEYQTGGHDGPRQVNMEVSRDLSGLLGLCSNQVI